LGDVTVSVKEQRPPVTVYVYVPEVRVASRTTTLGPLLLAPLERPRLSELHFEKESCASATPAPTVTLKVRAVLRALSEPEKVTVCVVGAGAGAGAGIGATSADTAVAKPALFDAVTATRSVEPM